jgi:multidrug efflux system outer membrane protein
MIRLTRRHIPPGLRGKGLPILLLAFLSVGCSTPSAPEVQLQIPTAFKEDRRPGTLPPNWKLAEPGEQAARGAWWTVFEDPLLDAMQAQAEQASPTLAAAAARVKAARAVLGVREAEKWPNAAVQAGAARTRPSIASLNLPEGSPVSPTTAWHTGLSAAYELDLFQRIENTINAASADAAGAEASYRAVLLVLQADVAQTYFILRTLDAEIAVLDATVKLRDEDTMLIGRRFEAGAVAEIDLARVRSQLAVVRAEAALLRGRRARAEHGLALLLGGAPAAFSLTAAPLPEEMKVPAVPPGLPSSLLERRPDVVAAQWRLQAATARVGAARAALFPALSLTADGGGESGALRDLFNWGSRVWLTSLVMSLPVVDGGRRRAVIEGAEAALDESVQHYRSAVLRAFSDVEDHLANIRQVQDQARHIETAAASAARAAELADLRYRAGEDGYLQLIDSQRSLLGVQLYAVQLRGQWAVATVGLIRSLGGGWSSR